MSNTRLFFISLFILVSLITFDTIAKVSSFYYYHPHADIIMHLIGGFSITALSMAVLRYFKMYSKVNVFIIIIFLSLFWEYIEFRIGRNIYINISFWIDTEVDLLMDVIGGIIAYICFHKIQNQKNLPS